MNGANPVPERKEGGRLRVGARLWDRRTDNLVRSQRTKAAHHTLPGAWWGGGRTDRAWLPEAPHRPTSSPHLGAGTPRSRLTPRTRRGPDRASPFGGRSPRGAGDSGGLAASPAARSPAPAPFFGPPLLWRGASPSASRPVPPGDSQLPSRGGRRQEGREGRREWGEGGRKARERELLGSRASQSLPGARTRRLPGPGVPASHRGPAPPPPPPPPLPPPRAPLASAFQ